MTLNPNTDSGWFISFFIFFFLQFFLFFIFLFFAGGMRARYGDTFFVFLKTQGWFLENQASHPVKSNAIAFVFYGYRGHIQSETVNDKVQIGLGNNCIFGN
ncbi:hypothetical protein MsAg5_14530 [Methanosarcinaceae archaeon Ag5]|uniref:Uncharacterized protein n=1 Tax=Methanolapillus africanus TaxID=3028297 RepID=A0AAE4MJC3_9EURY|nr:hypothetical protein [Methanosarcinaceae archaeon Ag5]